VRIINSPTHSKPIHLQKLRNKKLCHSGWSPQILFSRRKFRAKNICCDIHKFWVFQIMIKCKNYLTQKTIALKQDVHQFNSIQVNLENHLTKFVQLWMQSCCWINSRRWCNQTHFCCYAILQKPSMLNILFPNQFLQSWTWILSNV
jgi:hypothetical protein